MGSYTGLKWLIAFMIMISTSGCGVDAAYKWKTEPISGSIPGKYRTLIVDVQEKYGTKIGRQARNRLSRLVGDAIKTAYENRLSLTTIEKAGPETLHATVFITRYDDGRALAADYFQKPDRLHIDGELVLTGWRTGETLVEFEIYQTYDRNNSIGRFPRIEEIEPDFAQMLAAGMLLQLN